MKVKTKILTGIVAFMLSIVLLFTMVSISGKAGKSVEVSASTRTVSLEQNYFDAQGLWNDFDESDMKTNDDGFDLVARKSFDKSIFDEIDLVGLDSADDTFTVRYEISYIDSDDTILMTITIEGEDDIPVIETIPGLIAYNPAGEADVMFVVDDEYIWLSEMYDLGQIDNVGWFSNLIKKAIDSTLKAAVAAVKSLKTILQPAVKGVVSFSIERLGAKNLASAGASFLMMEVDEKDEHIYHAKFDCWQQYFGYTDLYDAIFDAGTSMRNAKFAFDIDGDNYDDYILWAWKGDYLNLGAGAELGIYSRWRYSDEIWKVDKSLAMKMSLTLIYDKVAIIDWAPEKAQWWITGFNWNYLDVDRDELDACFTVTFNNSTMFNAFMLANTKRNYGCTKIDNYKIAFTL